MTKHKRPIGVVLPVARGLVDRLTPACERIAIAGSLRRQMAEIGDIEIVAIPRFNADLFGNPTGESQIDALLRGWPVKVTKDGDRYKQFVFTGNSGGVYQVDLFLQPDPATWGVNLMIRTGSADFSRRMVTPKIKGGYRPDRYRVDKARVWCGPNPLDTAEERNVFDLWGMAYVEPRERGGRWQ